MSDRQNNASASDSGSDSGSNMPRHVAIILDGNGRWAARQSLDRIDGHRAGAENSREILRTAVESGIEYLTLFCFSSENWRRSQDEVAALMTLMQEYLGAHTEELAEHNVRLRVLGERNRLSPQTVKNIAAAERRTETCQGLQLSVALNYGGRWDICQAMRALADKLAAGAIGRDDIDENMIAAHLATAELPDPDLLIRSGGELRLSNFLLWQLAYSELIFIDKPWPAFDRDDFADCLRQYSTRIRRFGG